MKINIFKRYQLKKDALPENEHKSSGYEWCDIILHAMFDATVGAGVLVLVYIILQYQLIELLTSEILSLLNNRFR